jgi:hypothetical protein
MSKIVLASVLIRNKELKKQASVVDTLLRYGKDALKSDYVRGIPKAVGNLRTRMRADQRAKDLGGSPEAIAKYKATVKSDAPVLAPALKGSAIPATLTAGGTALALSGDEKPKDVVTALPDASPAAAPAPEADKTLADQYLGISTGSNIGDAAAAVAAAGGIYGLYQLLKKKKSEPSYVLA